jgi:anti-anti-sigma factor
MSREENTRVLRFSGDLDMVLAREIAGELSQAVGDITQAPVVDLRDVTFMDSMALAALAHAGEKLRNQGRTLALVIAPGPVEELLQESGLAERFELLSEPPETARGSTTDPTAAA